MTSRNDEFKETGVGALHDYLSRSGRGTWEVKSRPDEEDSSRPLPDFVDRRVDRDERAATEITSFDPADTRTAISSIRAVLDEIEKKLDGSLSGQFAVGGLDIPSVISQAVFAGSSRKATAKTMTDIIKDEGNAMQPGESRCFIEPFEFWLTRKTDSGSLSIKLGGFGGSVPGYAEEAANLNQMLAGNVPKFKDFKGVPHRLVVGYSLGEFALRRIAPYLSVPREIDELFFVVSERSRLRVIEYAALLAEAPPKGPKTRSYAG